MAVFVSIPSRELQGGQDTVAVREVVVFSGSGGRQLGGLSSGSVGRATRTRGCVTLFGDGMYLLDMTGVVTVVFGD